MPGLTLRVLRFDTFVPALKPFACLQRESLSIGRPSVALHLFQRCPHPRYTTPVASAARTPLVLVVKPSFPAKSVPLALAVTTPIHSPALPDVPTIGEFAAGYEASVWNGVVAPKDTPAAIIDKLHEAIDGPHRSQVNDAICRCRQCSEVDDGCGF